MTDNEIIKAYDGLTARQQLTLFRNIYYSDGIATEKGIVANALNDILPQFTRQKAEIERLTVNMNAFGLGMKREAERADIARAEAYKEFAERLKDLILPQLGISTLEKKEAYYFCLDEIDNLVKEMVGDNDG